MPKAKAKAKTSKQPPSPPPDRHVAAGLEYCRLVTTGKLPACKYVRLACQRHLNDLERAAKDPEGYPYVFDPERAGRAARFLELLPHVKGPKMGELFKLEPWQCFIVTTVFGWLRKNGQRRFRRVYIEVPRGNGKSFLSSGIALYALAADREGGADVYSAATTTEQARITWGDAEAMLKKRKVLQAKLGLRLTAHAIAQPSSNSTFKALSREAKNQEGKNIHLAVVDELHAHNNREVWDVLIMGAAKRTQSLIWAITTAGVDMSGICYEIRDGVVKMLEGSANEQIFGIVYTIDEQDDWKLEESWIKANPNWHASIDVDLFRLDATEAMQSASKENNFKTKHLNVWCNADVAWMQMTAWDECADLKLREADFAKEVCIVGLDLASKVDIAAKAKIFVRDVPSAGPPVDGVEPPPERHFYLFVQSYLPEQAVARSKNAQYVGWAKEGRIRTTPGDVIDFEMVKHDLEADRSRHTVREVAFDPWQAQQLANEMQAKGFTMVELRPIVQNFSAPMKELEALVLSKRFHHDGNPVMRWMVSNVVCHRDEKDNIYPRKEKPENKIDGPVATFMALNRALLAPVAAQSPYEKRGVLTV